MNLKELVAYTLESYKSGRIPEDFPNLEDIDWTEEISEEFTTYTRFRAECIKFAGFASLSHSWVRPLSKFLEYKKVLEVMSGAGLLAKILNEYGIDIKAIDDFSWIEQGKLIDREWTSLVENMDGIKAVETYGRDIDYLMVSWPYINNDMFEIIKKLHQINSSAKIIYIGELEGGTCASEKFFTHVYEDEINVFFNKEVRLNYIPHRSMWDKVVLYSIKECNDRSCCRSSRVLNSFR